jgi:hypothetical protein
MTIDAQMLQGLEVARCCWHDEICNISRRPYMIPFTEGDGL